MLPHRDYADTVWGDQPGLKSEMEKLAGRRLSHRCIAVENAIKGNIPQHFERFKSTLRS